MKRPCRVFPNPGPPRGVPDRRGPPGRGRRGALSDVRVRAGPGDFPSGEVRSIRRGLRRNGFRKRMGLPYSPYGRRVGGASSRPHVFFIRDVHPDSWDGCPEPRLPSRVREIRETPTERAYPPVSTGPWTSRPTAPARTSRIRTITWSVQSAEGHRRGVLSDVRGRPSGGTSLQACIASPR
jgi:hypothetical protein